LQQRAQPRAARDRRLGRAGDHDLDGPRRRHDVDHQPLEQLDDELLQRVDEQHERFEHVEHLVQQQQQQLVEQHEHVVEQQQQHRRADVQRQREPVRRVLGLLQPELQQQRHLRPVELRGERRELRQRRRLLLARLRVRHLHGGLDLRPQRPRVHEAGRLLLGGLQQLGVRPSGLLQRGRDDLLDGHPVLLDGVHERRVRDRRLPEPWAELHDVGRLLWRRDVSVHEQRVHQGELQPAGPDVQLELAVLLAAHLREQRLRLKPRDFRSSPWGRERPPTPSVLGVGGTLGSPAAATDCRRSRSACSRSTGWAT
jgi:hypothetical protein